MKSKVCYACKGMVAVGALVINCVPGSMPPLAWSRGIVLGCVVGGGWLLSPPAQPTLPCTSSGLLPIQKGGTGGKAWLVEQILSLGRGWWAQAHRSLKYSLLGAVAEAGWV